MRADKGSTILKWVGYATAILSLLAGGREIAKAVSDHVESRHRVAALLASEQIQLQSHDYESGWKSLEQAAQIGSESASVREARENLAMSWLENIEIQGDEKFSDIVAQLDPVLTRGAAAARSPQRQADLLAHLGWSYFLRSREGGTGLDPAETYGHAVAKDPDNPFANAMWGHWILWNHGDSAEADRHFSMALASNRERGFVRLLQLSALLNLQNEASDEQVVRVLNAMRKEGDSVPPGIPQRVWGMYYSKIIPPGPETTRFINSVPPREHVTTFRWLFDRLDLDQSASLLRLGNLATIEESAGQIEDAQSAYESIRREARGPGPLLTAAEAGSSRLSHKP